MSWPKNIGPWFQTIGDTHSAAADRLWPEDADIFHRARNICEEAGEVSRAITKRRHAEHAPDGTCKGRTVDEWTLNLMVELGQLVGVAADIAAREGIPLAPYVEKATELLEIRVAGS